MLKYTFSAATILLMLFLISCSETGPTYHPTGATSSNGETTSDPVEKLDDNHQDQVVVEQPEPEPVVEQPDEDKQRIIEKIPLDVGIGIQVQKVNPEGLRVREEPNLDDANIKGHVWDGDTGLITRKTHPLLHDIDDRFTWWYVKWDNGKEGWSAEAGLNGTRYLVVEH